MTTTRGVQGPPHIAAYLERLASRRFNRIARVAVIVPLSDERAIIENPFYAFASCLGWPRRYTNPLEIRYNKPLLRCVITCAVYALLYHSVRMKKTMITKSGLFL